MNISVIYGTAEKTCTYNCVQILLNNLKQTIPITAKEFFIEKEFSNKSDKFFSYFINGESIYIASNYIDYLINSLDDSDLIILASPTILCDITAELNSLLSHLFCTSIENNIKPSMNTKMGLVISTTSGAGLSYATSNLKKNLIYWGISNIFRFSRTIYESNWEYVDLKTKIKINKRIFKLSNKILARYAKSSSLNIPVSNKIIPYKFESNFKYKHDNVISLNLKKTHTYTHSVRKIH